MAFFIYLFKKCSCNKCKHSVKYIPYIDPEVWVRESDAFMLSTSEMVDRIRVVNEWMKH